MNKQIEYGKIADKMIGILTGEILYQDNISPEINNKTLKLIQRIQELQNPNINSIKLENVGKCFGEFIKDMNTQEYRPTLVEELKAYLSPFNIHEKEEFLHDYKNSFYN